MNQSRAKISRIIAYKLVACTCAVVLHTFLFGQLNDEIGRLIEASGEVTIVTNDGREINAVNTLSTADERGVPIKLGNKIITREYSSAVIHTLDDSFHNLDEMTSIQFGVASSNGEEKSTSILTKVVSFFTRQSGKAGDYRTDLVNTGWIDINQAEEPESDDE